ncbi:MAG TPA: hypothetical protein VFY70_07440 [Thermomicrobiales bacterium]|nr:hypothetical protein [Thermomicrobiales bacterium]
MDAPRFDALARSLARHLPRRGVYRTGAAAAALATFRATPRRAAAQGTQSVGLPCKPCNCTDGGCDCCLIGMTGGGVVRTQSGDVNLVLFATQLAADALQEAAGFVRWLDPNTDGGLTLESIGPIAYTWPDGEEHLRTVTGVMIVNGGEEHPFQLEVFDAGPGLVGQDTARLTVGDRAAGDGSGFTYEAAGIVVGGDLQLLSSVAPITPGG